MFASAIVLPFLIASNVGTKPIIPTIAVSKTSISSSEEIATNPSIPLNTSMFISLGIISFSTFALASLYTATYLGLNSFICSNNKFILLFADIATTSNLSLFALTTSNVCVPIEPVEPNIDIFFIYFLLPFC